MTLPSTRALSLVVLTSVSVGSAPRLAAQPVLRLGDSVNGTLASSDLVLPDGSHYDLHRLNVTAGRDYTVTMRSDDFDAFLAVGPGEDEMDWTDDDSAGGTDAQVTFTAPTSGTYLVRANSLIGEKTGAYTLLVTESASAIRPAERGPDYTGAPSVRAGSTVKGQLTSGDAQLEDGSYVDPYRISLSSGDRVTVTMRSEDFDTYLSIGELGSDGSFTQSESDDDGAGGTDSQITFTAPSSGSFVIRANSLLSGETGAYTLRLGESSGPDQRGADSSSGTAIDDVMQIQIDSAAVIMRGQGLLMDGRVRAGALASGAEERLSLALQGGRQYLIMGVCGQDCSDLDLDLVDSSGREVDSDYLEDDVPMVQVVPPQSGAYLLTVGMVACSLEPCEYGVAVFVQE